MQRDLRDLILTNLGKDTFAHEIKINSKDWLVPGISFITFSQIEREQFLEDLRKIITSWDKRINFSYIEIDNGVYACLIYQKDKKDINNTEHDTLDIKYVINKKITDKETGEIETVKLNKYTGHQTTKYNNISVVDCFTINGLKHTILAYAGKKTKYVIREDGEVFSLNEKGEWKIKVQYFCESGGVKNRARREAGKGGGSVYKCVSLWSTMQFLTHKLVKMYVTHEQTPCEYYISNGTIDSIVKHGKKTHIGENFYKGLMPKGFNKRCFKAN